mgnify:CR=1 FL=1
MISLLDILLLCRLVFRQVPQQALAAAQNVTVRPVKVIRIPRIFSALKDKCAKSQLISGIRTF